MLGQEFAIIAVSLFVSSKETHMIHREREKLSLLTL